MKLAFVFAFLLPIVASSWITEEFALFKAIYNKSYDNVFEEFIRQDIFFSNIQNVKRFNDNSDYYTQDVMNRFADRHDGELAKMNFGLRMEMLDMRTVLLNAFDRSCLHCDVDVSTLPKQLDWRKHGRVTDVKDQGACGSCWAFSATGAMEGMMSKHNKPMTPLSEQQILDCTQGQKYGMQSCEGGLPYVAMQYIRDNHGIESETAYPYEGQDETSCKFNPKLVKATDKAVDISLYSDEKHLLAAVATVGPISVAIHVPPEMMRYHSGVFYKPNCPSGLNTLNHAVLVVGYGTDEETGMDYWLVKNSWSEKWGENGYIRMARNKGNMCGIASMFSYPKGAFRR